MHFSTAILSQVIAIFSFSITFYAIKQPYQLLRGNNIDVGRII